MHHIRPHKLFKQVSNSSYEERMVRVVLPDQRAPILLETAVLLALINMIRPRNFLEIGTFLGIQTLNIAANLPADSRVFTLDLDSESLSRLRQAEPDKKLTQIHMEEKENLAFLGSSYESKITRIYGDSNNFDFSPFYRRMDMIYIDGGHDLQTLDSDTQNAYKMIGQDEPACIVWHDFENKMHPDVGPYLLNLSKSNQLFHVEETMLVFYLANAENISKSLLT